MRLQLSAPALLLCSCLLVGAAWAIPDEEQLAQCDSLFADKQFVEAASCSEALLAVVDARGDGSSTLAAEILNRLVRAQLSTRGALDPTCSAFVERLLRLTRSLNGAHHPEVAAAHLLAGQVSERLGNFPEARNRYEQALAVRSADGGPDDVGLANCLVFLANAKARLGEYDGLDDLYRRALAVAIDVSGAETSLVSRVLVNFAIYKKLVGDLAGARDLYDRTLGIQVRLNGEDHAEVARTYYNLGNLLVETGEYAEARKCYRKSLDIRERVLGSESADVARSLAGLALLEKRAANLLQAREYAERAVAIQQRILPPLHPQTANALVTLAAVQSDLGDLESARETMAEVLAVYERAYGPESLRAGEVIAELGMLRQLAGDLPGAGENYRRARFLYQATEAENDRVAGILSVEAVVSADMGRTARACSLATRSLAIREGQLDPAHPALGRSLAILGRCRWQGGDLAGAESVLARSLGILAPVQDETSPIYLSAQFDLARVKRSRGAATEALDLALAVERGRRDILRLTVSGLPERLALIHADKWPNGLDLAVTLAAESAPTPREIARVWTELIRSRALVLDAMAWRCRSTFAAHDAATNSLQTALTTTTRELASLLVAGWQEGSSADIHEQARDLRRQREQIEQEIWEQRPGNRDATAAEAVTLAGLRQALPADTALVGYLRFGRHLKTVVVDTLVDSVQFTAPAYVAFVLPAGRANPVLVDLGAGAEIDRLVRVWRDEAGSGRQLPGRDAAVAAAACRRAGTELRKRIWDPLLPHLRGAGTVDVVLDGSLNLVNLAALPLGEERYLIDENRRIVHLAAERDLVDHQVAKSVAGALLALGAPDFSTGLGPYEFAPLPASAEEVQAITSLWRDAGAGAAGTGIVLALLGREASEAAFKQLAPKYKALHLATHGFFLTPGSAGPLPGQRGVSGLKSGAVAGREARDQQNPMLRSGLVLASDPDPASANSEDGILTAAEISVLDLSGVDWVVLSACDSGVGDVLDGEGVFGLRRAFRIAGATNLVASLWPLADDLMRDWMLQLYQAHLTARLDLVSATWQASRAVLAARRSAGLDTHPQTWAGFIASGQ